MKEHEYRGRVINTRVRQQGAAWRGSYQIDGGPVIDVAAMPEASEPDGAHADALGQAMGEIDLGAT